MPEIDFGSESDLLLHSGVHFIGELKCDGEQPGSPLPLRRDWQTLAAWLDHAGGTLTKSEKEKAARGWAAYLALGLAPSDKLQPAFDHFSRHVRSAKSDRPPKEVLDVFDRLLATDADILQKREMDWAAEKKRFDVLFNKAPKTAEESWWWRQSSGTRTWLFGTGVWIVGVSIYALVFDPFDAGGWRNMNNDEVVRLVVVASLPVAGAILWKLYEDWVR